jgi:uncharacterized protein YqhQ
MFRKSSAKENEIKQCTELTVGGEALIEGVMMRGKATYAIAVRKQDGSILVEKHPLLISPRYKKIKKTPILRGAIGIFESMRLGIKSLMYSAEIWEESEESEEDAGTDAGTGNDSEPSKPAKKNTLTEGAMIATVAVSMLFGIGLFILLPNLIVKLLGFNNGRAGDAIIYNILEGIIRVAFFLIYIFLVSRMKELKRVFQYHGAEHKTVYCYEHGEELTVENVRKYSTRHPRCGTALLFLVMLVSIIVFTLVGVYSTIINIILRVVLIPLVAGISYEIAKYSGKSESLVSRIVRAPGLMLQRLTALEPDDEQIEVAIAALKPVVESDS